MASENSHTKQDLRLPRDAGEKFLVAIEAATGEEQRANWGDPMSGEQAMEAMGRLLTAPYPDRGLELLVRDGIMEPLMPEVFAVVGFGEGIRHKDVWAHTKQVVRQAPPRLTVRWAALLHDIGKVPTRRFEPGGQVTFIGHPEVGARLFDRIARRMPFPLDIAEHIRFLITAHLRAAGYEENWTDSAVRRFARDVGDDLVDLLDLARADITSKHTEKIRRGMRQINLLSDRIADLQEQDEKPVPLPTGLGTALMDRFEIVPGPGLGRLMNALKAAVEEGDLQAGAHFDHYLDYVQEHDELRELLLTPSRPSPARGRGR